MKTALISLCVIFTVFALLKMLFYREKNKKATSFVLAVTLVFAVITVISGSNINFDELNIKANTSKPSTELSEIQAKQVCEIALEENNIQYESVEVSMDILKDNSIEIKRVKVISNADSENIKVLLTKELSVEGEVIDVE